LYFLDFVVSQFVAQVFQNNFGMVRVAPLFTGITDRLIIGATAAISKSFRKKPVQYIIIIIIIIIRMHICRVCHRYKDVFLLQTDYSRRLALSSLGKAGSLAFDWH